MGIFADILEPQTKKKTGGMFADLLKKPYGYRPSTLIAPPPEESRREFLENAKAGFLPKTSEAWKRGGELIATDFLWHRAAMGEINEETALRAEKQFKELSKQNLLEGRNWLENLWLNTVQMARPMAEGTLQGMKYGAGLGIAAGIAGQAGPQIATLEEIGTMPTAYAIGQVGGTMKYWSEQGSGSIYRQARKRGLSPKAASHAAAAGGPVYAFIEYSQVDKIIPGLGKIKGNLLDKAIKIGLNAAQEIAEEGAQKIVTDGAVSIAELAEGNIDASDIPDRMKEIGKNALNEMKEAAGPMALLQLPNAMVTMGQTIAESEKTAEPTITQEPVLTKEQIPRLRSGQISEERRGQLEAVKGYKSRAEFLAAQERFDKDIAELDEQAIEHLRAIAQEGLKPAGPIETTKEAQIIEPAKPQPQETIREKPVYTQGEVRSQPSALSEVEGKPEVPTTRPVTQEEIEEGKAEMRKYRIESEPENRKRFREKYGRKADQKSGTNWWIDTSSQQKIEFDLPDRTVRFGLKKIAGKDGKGSYVVEISDYNIAEGKTKYDKSREIKTFGGAVTELGKILESMGLSKVARNAYYKKDIKSKIDYSGKWDVDFLIKQPEYEGYKRYNEFLRQQKMLEDHGYEELGAGASRGDIELSENLPPRKGDLIGDWHFTKFSKEGSILSQIIEQYGDFDVELGWRNKKPQIIKASILIDMYEKIIADAEDKSGDYIDYMMVKKTPQAEQVPEVTAEKPETETPTKRGPNRIMSGFDPGVDKFISEDIKPGAKRAIEVAKAVIGVAKAIPRMFLSVLEPARIAEKRAGKNVYVALMKMAATPDIARLEFEQQYIDAVDTNLEELRKYFDSFSKEDRRNFLIAYGGQAQTPVSSAEQQAAENALPAELKNPKLIEAVREISERNYEYLKRVSQDAGRIPDYFYGLWKDPVEAEKIVQKFYKTTEKFTKKKFILSVADGVNRGLEPRYDNYIDNLRAEYIGIARLEAMRFLKQELEAAGKDVLIAEFAEAPAGFEKVNDPVFVKDLVAPEVAQAINKLIAANKVTQHKVGNAFRQMNNVLRIGKFIGSLFHMGVEIEMAMADSGYLGFLYKPTAYRWATLATKRKWSKIKQTAEYKKYVSLGFGERYSQEEQAAGLFKKLNDQLASGNYIGATGRLFSVPLRIPTKFTDWMFNQWIPMVKFMKLQDAVREIEQKKGRQATDYEIIQLIKEQQNFYGEMNERLFGRSGTTTTAMRFVWLAPGFAEGNYRTIVKGLTQWGFGEGYSASRSRANMLNTLVLAGILAAIGTRILIGKWPKEPETLEDMRDLFKIDTGKVDAKGRPVMIDLLRSGKDYWNIMFNTLRGRPDEAVKATLKRLGGMKAPLFEMIVDMAKIANGEALYDWKGDRVVEVTDTWTEKLLKIANYESKKIEPISVSVYKTARRKQADKIVSFLEAVTGVRPTLTEKDKREQATLRLCWSLKDQKEGAYYRLGEIDNPREAVKRYNDKVKDVLEGPLVSPAMRKEWTKKLIIDLDKYLENRAFEAASNPSTKDGIERQERAVKLLKNFKISGNEAVKFLEGYYKRIDSREKRIMSPIERDRILGRALKKNRLSERLKE